MKQALLESLQKVPLVLWFFLLCLLILPLFPQLDLWITGLFYDQANAQFALGDARPITRMYWFLAAIDAPLVLTLIGLVCWSFYKHWESYRKRLLAFLLITLIVGPGLITNTILKDNSIGRPRPVHIEQFGGERNFSPAVIYSGECSRNCSFVSGHAALGFWFMVLGWAFRSRKAFYLGLGIGCLAGLGRVIQGGHFFSDVVFAFWVVFFTLAAVSYLLKLPPPVNLWANWQDFQDKPAKTET